MSLNITSGATLTGGSSVALASAGVSPGRSVFASPDSTRLTPELVTFTSSTSGRSGSSPGKAKVGLKIAYSDRQTEEGCCSAQSGQVIVDMGLTWDLSQPETLVDKVIAHLRGLVYTTAFVDAVKKGILPA